MLVICIKSGGTLTVIAKLNLERERCFAPRIPAARWRYSRPKAGCWECKTFVSHPIAVVENTWKAFTWLVEFTQHKTCGNLFYFYFLFQDHHKLPSLHALPAAPLRGDALHMREPRESQVFTLNSRRSHAEKMSTKIAGFLTPSPCCISDKLTVLKSSSLPFYPSV